MSAIKITIKVMDVDLNEGLRIGDHIIDTTSIGHHEARLVVREIDVRDVEPSGDGLTHCDGCAGQLYAGIRWPASPHGDDSRSWVERCDNCERYEDDNAACARLREIYEHASATITYGTDTPAGISGTLYFLEVA